MTPENILELRSSISMPESVAAPFEQAAAKLLSLFAPYSPLPEQPRWQPELVSDVEIVLDHSDGPLVRERPDQKTFVIVELEVTLGHRSYHLASDGCGLLDILAEQWALHPCIRGLTTPRAMRERLKAWCFEVLRSEQSCSAVDFVMAALRHQIDIHEVWVMLSDIDVEDSFPMGKVSICGIGSEQVAGWMEALIASGLDESRRAEIQSNFERDWQGHTAAVYRRVSDVDAAKVAAIEHAERACAVMRMVEPGNVSATQRSYLQPQRLLAQVGINSVLIDPTTLGHSMASEPTTNPPCGISIDRVTFPEKWVEGNLGVLNDLLSTNTPTAFQRDLLGALLVYSRHRLTSDPVEKLTLVFSALEAVLPPPGGNRAPIKFTLRKRISAMFAGNENVRRHIAKIVDEAYRLRSGFLHHGSAIKDRRAVEAFLQYSWLFFLRVINQHKRWTTVRDFCLGLDDAYKARFGDVKGQMEASENSES